MRLIIAFLSNLIILVSSSLGAHAGSRFKWNAMMKYIQCVSCLFLLASGLFAQQRYENKISKQFIDDLQVTGISTSKGVHDSYPDLKTAAIMWHLVDSSVSAYTMGQGNCRPLAYSPGMNTLLFTHRLDGFFTGEDTKIWGNVSTDGGTTWRHYSNAYNANDYLYSQPYGRYPAGEIFNPLSADDTTTALAFIGCPSLIEIGSTVSYGDIFVGANSLTRTCISCDEPFGYRIQHSSTDRVWYSYQTPQLWSSKQYMFWAVPVTKDGSEWRGLAILKSPDLSSPPSVVIPPQLDSTKIYGIRCPLNGDAIDIGGGVTKMATGIIGNVIRQFNTNPDSVTYTPSTIAVTYSTDEGDSWSELDTVSLRSIPGLGIYRDVGFWRPSAPDFISAGLVLDSLGFPHVALVLQDTVNGSSAVAGEVYRDATGWKGKIVEAVNFSTQYTWGTGQQSINQNGPDPLIARNNHGTVFMYQYTSTDNANDNADIFVSIRKLTSGGWKAPINATQTSTLSENLNSCAHYLRSDGGDNYTLFMALAIPQDPSSAISHTRLYEGEVQLNASFGSSSVQVCNPGSAFSGYYTIDSLIRPTFCFGNIGIQQQTDTLGYNLKIFDSLSQAVYFDSLRFCCLAPGESREYEFSIFSPPGLGKFSFKVYSATGQHDSAGGIFYLVTPSPFVTSLHAVKYQMTYAEIPVVDNGPRGDDSTLKVPLPFPFVYNAHTYDTVLISTNGFIQFGDTGTTYKTTMGEGRGSGLQNAVHDNGDAIIGTAYNHFLSPWHDDLNTSGLSNANGDSGHISYTTLWSIPNRIFIVQWKNVNATFDHLSDGTRINFQVRLYEGTNLIDFMYGERTTGSFVNTQGAQGASIALKDETGGPYHYFDIYKGWYGNEKFLKTDLNPNTDWPGANTAYRIYKNKMITINISPRWNLVSMPTAGFNVPVCQIFPSAIGCVAWAFDNHGYRQVTTLNQGRGYWIKFSFGGPLVLKGALPVVDDSVTTGWNLIGTVDHPIPAPSGGLVIAGTVYGYGGGYHSETTLQPGQAYFVKAYGTGTVAIGPAIAPKENQESVEPYNSITIRDNTGDSQTLYFSESTGKGQSPDNYEMPPLPPSENFDARFASGSMLEKYPAEIKGPLEFTIAIQSTDYPVEVSWNVLNDNGKNFSIIEKEGDKIIAIHNLSGATGEFRLVKEAAGLSLRISTGKLIPKEFVLEQNYPNPFNPVTIVNYQLPNDNYVTLKIYNLLGQEVKTLVDHQEEAGYKSVSFDAANLASGVYLYELRAGSFTAVRKMVVMK